MLGHSGLGSPNLAALGAAGGGIGPVLFTNVNIVHFPVMVMLDNIPVFPVHFTDPDIFRTPAFLSVAGQIFPEHWEDPDTFYAPSSFGREIHNVGNIKFPNTFYAPTITLLTTAVIAPSLHIDLDVIYSVTADTVDKVIEPIRFAPGNIIWQPQVNAEHAPIIYDYPIGHSLYSDYGIRASRTYYKPRLVLGRRPR